MSMARTLALVVALAQTSHAKRIPAFEPDPNQVAADAFDAYLNYEPVNPILYPDILANAGREPMLMAYLDDGLADYEATQKIFNESAAAISCLAKGGTRMMKSGNDVRARFAISQDGVTLPALSIFRRTRRSNFQGNWTVSELRAWAYSELAGLTILNTQDDYYHFKKTARKTAIAFVDSFCSARSAAFSAAMMEHRERTATNIPAALSLDSDLARVMGIPSGTGMFVTSDRGDGPHNVFPEGKGASWTSDELQQFVLGMLGKDTKLEDLPESPQSTPNVPSSPGKKAPAKKACCTEMREKAQLGGLLCEPARLTDREKDNKPVPCKSIIDPATIGSPSDRAKGSGHAWYSCPVCSMDNKAEL